MSYQALYRKYRPKNFDEVLGQEAITQVLRNQIRTRTVGHAYLFSGIRGTGKTSMAKIMAKAVNCLDPRDGNPCNQCEVCRSVNQENFMDVMEIDAASNNGVDNIRELREHSKYTPSKGKYKVYIIDEVQMLSTGAFNALLKTLEEPSEHVLFILATTEPQKIPVTILSRCQRFDFKRVSPEAMAGGLERILKDLDITYDAQILPLIAHKSEGAMRDALSLLEKIVGFQGSHLALDVTLKTLGYVAHRDLLVIFEGIVSDNLTTALETLDSLIKEGIPVAQLMEQFLEFIRNAMLVKVFKGASDIIELPREQQMAIYETLQFIELKDYARMTSLIHEGMGNLKYAANPRINLELMMISLSLIFKQEEAGQLPEVGETGPREKVPREIAKAPSRPIASQAPPQEATQALKGNWERVLKRLSDENKMIYAFLIEGEFQAIKDNEIAIVYESGYDFHLENLMATANKAKVEEIVAEIFGEPYQIKGIMKGRPPEKKDLSETVREFLGEEYQDILDIK
ncbi:MAG: hypothetical protein AVO33_03125 [delta proteobacterium ML8_F1]|nr:MAG: hypothetical protein AVO33_03125 [delta proteobacterium ML8_F1]